MTQTQWPDTTDQPPPPEPGYWSALWLLGRHPDLAALAARVPDLVHQDDDGTWYLDLNHLATVITRYDAARATGRGMDALDPAAVLTIPVHHFGVMSGTEQARLRLLAVFATARVPLRALDVTGLDAAGQRLLADWCTALQTH